MTRVTVVMAVRDGANFVGAAVESALEQTLHDFRVIVVDDGSTDATPTILARFGSRITVVTQEKRGLSAARNRGLALADGDYVTFFDHDDLWEPTFLEHAVERLAGSSACTAGTVTGWTRIDLNGREVPRTRVRPRGTLTLGDFVLGNRFPPGSVVLRRRAVNEVGGFDLDPAVRRTEDWDLWLRLGVAGWQFTSVEACLWRYRLHDGSLSSDPSAMRDAALHTLGRLFTHPTLPDDVRRLRPRAIGYVLFHASEALYALGRPGDAARDFAGAVRECPAFLDDDETYYAIICAEQPSEHKASPLYLDLAKGQAYILGALAACRASSTIDDVSYRRAVGRAYTALAALAYGQRRMHAVRRYVGGALRADAALWRDRRTLVPAIKSLAGARLVDALSRWRRRARADGTRTTG